MEVASRPVPRVPPLPINAPAAARDPHALVPAPMPIAPPEGPIEELLDHVPIVLPGRLAEPIFKAVSKINRVFFRSAPPGAAQPVQPGSWHFSVIGDYGSGTRPLTDVTNNIARRNPEAVLTTGDNVYWSGTEAEYRRKWDPPKYFGDIRANFRVLPSLGNHDTRKSTKPYFDRFPELEGARFYSADLHDVHFVALNTNESLAPGSPQHEWLERDLAASQKKWKVLYYHHPAYSNFPGHVSPLREYLGPLVARYGVDLLLAGHEHSYGRSKPLNATGTVELITGGGGHTLHPFWAKQLPHSAYRDVDYGHLDFEVRNDAIVGRYIVRDGTVRDTFTVRDNPGTGTGTAGTRDAATGAVQVREAASAARRARRSADEPV